MFTGLTKTIVALIATALLFVFILGLAQSISAGFAGFWGGLPFWVISLGVLSLVAYNYWEECLKKK